MSKRDRSGKFYQALFAGVDEPGLCERDRDKNIPEILRSMCAAKEFCLLDIGCGLGKVARIAKEQFPKARVFGVDCSARIVERAKGFGPGIDYRVCDEVSLPFEDGFFDYATCRMSIHHYPRIEEHLCEVRRVLKENAIYLIMDIVPEEGEQNRCLNQVFLAAERDAPGDGHVKFYTLAEYEELLGRRGFCVEHVVYGVFGVAWPKTDDYYRSILSHLKRMPASFKKTVAFEDSGEQFRYVMRMGNIFARARKWGS